jgi:hypothetical protein
MSQRDPTSLNRDFLAARIAKDDDLDGVTATLTAAFEADPLWWSPRTHTQRYLMALRT